MQQSASPIGVQPKFNRNLADDLISGFVIFLIALPLSVGIAIASGAPPTAGIIAAIVGGVVGSWLGGSYLTINGPAAGLIVIVVGAIQDLGHGDPMDGYRKMLAVLVVAGILQVAMGMLRLGALGLAVPGSVIHGMLTAIGVIIIVKQSYVTLGVTPTEKEIIPLIKGIPHAVQGLNPEVALIAAIGFIVILSHNLMKGSWKRYVPAPLLVVISGLAMAKLFDFEHSHLVSSHWLNFEVGPKLLLALPDRLASAIVFPDFSAIFSLDSLRYVIAVALVGSIESLLSATAVDRLDPEKRVSDLNRELWSKGICNAICGLVGGLPIIAEMVRSSANISNGAKSRWSNFFHGSFILAFLIMFPSVLKQIPLAALAAILVAVGYSLAHPRQLLHTAKIGRDHLAAYLVTLGVTLASDLLIGVFAGVLVELIFNVARGARPSDLFRLHIKEETDADGRLTLTVESPLTFTNYLMLKRKIDSSEDAYKSLLVDLKASRIVDHTVVDNLNRFKNNLGDHGRSFDMKFSDSHAPVSKHPLAARRLLKTREIVATIER